MSDTTEVLLRNRLPLRPLGEHVLQGLRRQISVYQVITDGLPTEFPVLRSAERSAGNLPRQLTSLVGRDELVRQGAELVRDRQLVTLTGVSGVGKTRMALEIGAELAGEFPDGAWLVELAAVGDPGSIPAAITSVLRITPQGESPLIATIAAALAGQRLLLVIDNCAPLLKAAGAAIEMITGRSANVRVVATSREPLGMDAEAVLGVSRWGRPTAPNPTPSRCCRPGARRAPRLRHRRISTLIWASRAEMFVRQAENVLRPLILGQLCSSASACFSDWAGSDRGNFGHIPQGHGAVATCGCERVPVGAESHRGYGPLLSSATVEMRLG